MTKKLRIVPLGGLGEIGKNMMLYEYGENILVVDTGIMFPENDMLGIDYIIPDFDYLMNCLELVGASSSLTVTRITPAPSTMSWSM